MPHSGVSADASSQQQSKSAGAKAALTSPGLAMLRRVLLAYSFHNPAVGYAQSMNFLCALLLLFMDEEEAFYMLIILLEDICCIEVASGRAADGSGTLEQRRLFYHSPDLAGAHIDQKVYADLVAEKLPRLAAHFERLSFPLAPLTMSWLLCLFVNTLPLETTLVIWDVLMSEGVKILFRASLTLLKVHEKQILKCADFEETLITLKSCSAFHPTLATVPPTYAAAVGAAANGDGGAGSAASGAAGVPTLIPPAIDTAGFMRICFDPLFIGSFPLSKIQALRNFHCLEVEAQLAARRSKIRANKEKQRINKQAAAAAAAAASGKSSSRAPSRSPALKASGGAVDPSVEFTLTSSPPRASLLDPKYSERLPLFETVAHASQTSTIHDYYSPPTNNSSTSDEFVSIHPPMHVGGSPRVGPPIKLDADESHGHAHSLPPPVLASAADAAASSADDDALSPSASSPVPASRPARPSFNTVKQAIKRASLVPVKAEDQQGESLAEAAARAHPPAAPSVARRPSVSGASVSPPQQSATSSGGAGAPSSTGVLSSMFNSMGRALSQVLTELTEDERIMEQRRLEQAARRDQEARAAAAGRPPLRTASGSPPQSRPLQGTTPPTGTPDAALTASSTPPRRSNSLTSQTPPSVHSATGSTSAAHL